MFNESIKENILFGDLNANDKHVREVAVKANALQFIMANEEDVTSESV